MHSWKTFDLSIVIAAVHLFCGCSMQASSDSAGTMIQLNAFGDEQVRDQLGPEWRHVAPGVFERHGDHGKTSRVAVGRSGLEATLTRLHAEIDTIAASGETPATPEQEGHVRSLRVRVADLESLNNRQLAFRHCNNSYDFFFAQASVYYDSFGAHAESMAGRLDGGSNPAVSSESYAYAGVFSGFWPVNDPAPVESYGNSTNPAVAGITTQNFYQCGLYTSAWVSPACPEAYVVVDEAANCEP